MEVELWWYKGEKTNVLAYCELYSVYTSIQCKVVLIQKQWEEKKCINVCIKINSDVKAMLGAKRKQITCCFLTVWKLFLFEQLNNIMSTIRNIKIKAKRNIVSLGI